MWFKKPNLRDEQQKDQRTENQLGENEVLKMFNLHRQSEGLVEVKVSLEEKIQNLGGHEVVWFSFGLFFLGLLAFFLG